MIEKKQAQALRN